jgi:hypothetical protein
MEMLAWLITYLTVCRIFALTYLNRLVAMSFASITLVQFIVGLIVASMWNRSGMHAVLHTRPWLTSEIHTDKSKLSLNYICTITLDLNLELVYFALSLFFGRRTQSHLSQNP